ncbi:MAG: methyltransferase domain-containing protein [Planctomycetota bacterium]
MKTELSNRDSYGQHKLSWVDRFGVFLSLRAIVKRLPKGDSLEVMDLGCGYRARLLVALQNRLKNGVGVDFQICPELKNNPRLTFMESSIEQAVLKLADASFDVIFFISVLEHLWDPAEILKQCHRLLKPGGILLVNVPTWRGKFFLELAAFKLGVSPKLEMDDHKMYYDKRDLWPLLVKAGFKPSLIALNYHKFGLNLFATVRKEMVSE